MPEQDGSIQALAGEVPAVSVKGLVKFYGANKAVDGIDLVVKQGELLALLGPNGAGKTTTLEIIEGLKKSDAGTVELFGLPHKKARRLIGVQLQEGATYSELTCAECIQLFASLYGCQTDPGLLLDWVGLGELAKRRTDQLSGGQKRRFSIALALCNDPRLIILDEPTTGLDPHSRRDTWELIRLLHKQGRSILLTTHYIEEAEVLADRVVIVDQGRVVAQGSPIELINELGSEVTVSLTAPEEAALKDLPGVTAATFSGGRWYLRCSNPGEVVGELTLRLGSQGLKELSVNGPSLEDVFLVQTGHHIGDDDENNSGNRR